MAAKTLKFRVRHRYRRSRRQVEGLSQQAEEHIEQHFVSRLTRLFLVKRFVLAWVLLIVLLAGCVVAQTDALSGYYQTLEPVPGGIYTEGILGDFTTADPLYATSPVDSSVSRLVFASLFTYNSSNQLTGDLASSWSVDSTGRIYTVKLKPGLTWQDGKPLTAADVAFTYQTIQNPNAQSPLNSSWQNIQVAASDRLTVTFTLLNPLVSFPYSLTNGIVPKHLLAKIPASKLRLAGFNVNPVGSGPFAWQSLAVQGNSPQTRQEQVNLVSFTNYQGGAPKLNQFIVRAFHNKKQLINSFQSGELTAMSGLDSVPTKVVNDSYSREYSLSLTAADMIFFKTSSGVLSDPVVRKALVEGADVNKILLDLGHATIPVREPLLKGQLGYDPAYQQQTGKPTIAESSLQAGGWILGANGIRSKAGQPLQFKLYAPDTLDSYRVTNDLKTQWRAIGADVQVVLQNNAEMQNTLTFHAYDALLYGISIGVDPDVFSYWDSSQANPSSPTRSNFSEYTSKTADEGLEAARTISDPALRAVKYKTFLQAWQGDAPALGLYQPRFLYIASRPIYGLGASTINQATDRYNNVQNWEIRQGEVTDK